MTEDSPAESNTKLGPSEQKILDLEILTTSQGKEIESLKAELKELEISHSSHLTALEGENKYLNLTKIQCEKYKQILSTRNGQLENQVKSFKLRQKQVIYPGRVPTPVSVAPQVSSAEAPSESNDCVRVSHDCVKSSLALLEWDPIAHGKERDRMTADLYKVEENVKKIVVDLNSKPAATPQSEREYIFKKLTMLLTLLIDKIILL